MPPTPKKHNKMKIKSILALSTLALTCFNSPAKADSAPAKTVSIIAYDTMKFNVTKIEAHPGQKLTVELKNEGTAPKAAMTHNWILLKAGEDATSYSMAAMTAKADGYEPKALASKVVASIPHLGPKESGKVTFTVPSTPGNYPFLCTFPAHCMAGMKGVLVVK